MSLVYTDITGSIEFDKLSKHKENIQPVNSGRTVSQLTQIVDLATTKPVLSSLLTSPQSNTITGTSEQRLIKTRVEDSHSYYDEQISNYQGDDVLSVWVSYIEELQTSTYSSSLRSIVCPAIEACINHLCTSGPTSSPDQTYLDQYRNDPRFIKLCFQLCETVNDPLRIYRFLQSKEIAQKDAKFFLNYSTALYLHEHYKSAMEVLYIAMKHKVEPTPHLKNRYKYLIQCEKQRISKILGHHIDDSKLQQLVKSKDPQIVGKFYSFSYNHQTDNILGDQPDSTDPRVPQIQRGLSVVYKEEFQNGQDAAFLAQSSHKPPQQPPKCHSSSAPLKPPANAPSSSGIFVDDSDEDGLTDQRAVRLISPQVKKHSILATTRNRGKENVQPYTGDFQCVYDADYIEALDHLNAQKGIHSVPIGVVPVELPKSHITAGIYCDDDDDDDE